MFIVQVSRCQTLRRYIR